jgi:hypothetical protein
VPPLEHRVGLEAHQVGQDEDVGLVRGSDRALLSQSVREGGIERGHDQGVFRRDTRSYRLSHHPVHVTVVRDVLRVAVVGAEGDPRRSELLHEREEVEQVPRHRGLADEEPHPRADPLSALLDGQRLVIGLDARRGIGLERLAEERRCVSVDMLRPFKE